MGWPTSLLLWSSNAISAPRDASTPSERSGPERTSSAPIRIGWPRAILTTPTSSVTGPSVSACAGPLDRIVTARQPAANPRRTVRRSISRHLAATSGGNPERVRFDETVQSPCQTILIPPPGSPAACGPCTPCGTGRGAAAPAPAGPRWRSGRPASDTMCPSMKPPRLPVASNTSSNRSASWAGVPAIVVSQAVALRRPWWKNSSRVISVSAPSPQRQLVHEADRGSVGGHDLRMKLPQGEAGRQGREVVGGVVRKIGSDGLRRHGGEQAVAAGPAPPAPFPPPRWASATGMPTVDGSRPSASQGFVQGGALLHLGGERHVRAEHVVRDVGGGAHPAGRAASLDQHRAALG